MPTPKDTARTARLRENKRRSRERQRQYTLDLEQQLRQFQQKRIEATVEVQTAAKLVAEENRHLRSLLYHLGVDDSAIAAWLASHAISKTTTALPGQQERPKVQAAASTCVSNAGLSVDPQAQCNREQESSDNDWSLTACETLSLRSNSPRNSDCVYDRAPEVMKPASSFSGTAESSLPARGRVSPNQPTQTNHAPHEASPCKLLSRITADSVGNMPQVINPSVEEMEHGLSQDGISCSAAYQLLMQHATSEEKINSLARTLEEGCVPISQGGCQVKTKTVAEALVNICL
ncbi:bZIP transcription factor [Aspergillus lucknowensis]|uniref:BZIP domain-containing protein n=1 Tax=Aspergillus lucknowensis TaxID=176173 RepID=A0ABR4LFQ5_9EURO